MHAWYCDDLSGPAGLRWRQSDAPEPGPTQVRIAIRAASLNFPDVLIVHGKYQFKPAPPFVPGSEYSGTIEAVGSGVDGWYIGDRVASIAGVGGFGTHACSDVSQIVALPAEMPYEEGAAFTLTYGTGHHALVDRAGLRSGETLLVLGAAGGVGTAAIQIGKALGARVIAAVSSEAKAAFCRKLGADLTIDYGKEPLRDAIKAATGGAGPDVIFDPVGGELTEPAFRSIAWRGRYLVIGFAQGTIPALPLNLTLLKGASVVGVFWGDFVRREPEGHARTMAELSEWYAAGRIRPVLDLILPLDRLAQGYQRMTSREAMGKIVVRP